MLECGRLGLTAEKVLALQGAVQNRGTHAGAVRSAPPDVPQDPGAAGLAAAAGIEGIPARGRPPALEQGTELRLLLYQRALADV